MSGHFENRQMEKFRVNLEIWVAFIEADTLQTFDSLLPLRMLPKIDFQK